MLVIIRGAGDIASGIALRLHRAGIRVVMTDLPRPTAIRTTVCFSRAIAEGTAKVEDVTGIFADSTDQVEEILENGGIAVLADPACRCREVLRPDALVDAILAKRNLGTTRSDAPVVIGVGPGFFAGRDCHAVVETMRGHDLGRVILQGEAMANTGVPGDIGGYTTQRVLRAPRAGKFQPCLAIGQVVRAGQVAATVEGAEMRCTIDGVLRGILPAGTEVFAGMKSGDIDPRCAVRHCFYASDKALAVGGGVLEAILQLTGALREKSRKNQGNFAKSD